MKLAKEEVKNRLSDMLEECLESCNQDGSFIVKYVDLKNMKFCVEFDIVKVEEDDYIGFAGY